MPFRYKMEGVQEMLESEERVDLNGEVGLERDIFCF